MSEIETLLLDRPDGRVSYDDNGVDGPLIIAAPGMGDLRHSYRFIREPIATGGNRLLTMDLRGMGESSTDWSALDDAAVASDFLALVKHVDAGPAVLVGNSLSCASAVLAATEAPESVAGIVLLGPFVRDVPTAWWQSAVFRVMLTPPWGRSAWTSYYRKNLYPERQPSDHDEYVAALAANLKESGRFASFRRISSSSHQEADNRLGSVTQPVLVIMGTEDPDFPDPVAEANRIVEQTGGTLILSQGSGHYPQADNPDLTAEAILEFMSQLPGHDG